MAGPGFVLVRSILLRCSMAFLKNHPNLWRSLLPVPARDAHKYSRGHVVVFGGVRLTGAARLASEGVMRIGAGICTIIADRRVALVEPLKNFAAQIQNKRCNSILIGPGAGVEKANTLRSMVVSAIKSRSDCSFILDADALNAFEGRSSALFEVLDCNCVLTPHEGEFERLFGVLPGSKVEKAQSAAKRSRAVVVFKGAETVIAHPDGRVVVNDHSTPYLASAGTGDVLAGMIAGLLAQGMDPFNGACAAVWLHGDAGIRVGPGLVAPDLISRISCSIARDIA